MPKLVTIFGGSGFLGRYIARHMAKQGWRVRVAVRRPNEATFVKPYGAVGQVEPIFCNIRDDASVAAALSGADAVVNCVGTFDRTGRNSFDAVQHEGAERIAVQAALADVATLVHVSAIGADANGKSEYARSKGKGEAGVLAHMPDAVILRPSVMFGNEDGFFNRFAAMTKFGPVLPIVGGSTKFQPVYVDDVAQAAVRAVTGGNMAGIYELGGPEAATLGELIDVMLETIQRKRLVLDLPFGLGRLMGSTFDLASAMTFGLFRNTILTRDQAVSLETDNVVSAGMPGLEAFDIKPTPMDGVIEGYLWPYRPSGQYAAIKNSARKLKT
jgi:NADH dehydrogenase